MSWPSVQGAQSVLAVVPARGGSKAWPGKNLKQVGGLSLVGRAARLACSLDWIDRAVLSTDDAHIAAEGVRYGLDAPFLRPPELASDTASSVDMWRHAWLSAEEHFGRRFDVSLLLEPTSPLRRAEDLAATMTALVAGGHRSAATVSRTPAHYTPHKTLTVDDEGRIGFYRVDGAAFATRQRIPSYFHRNGLCYAATRGALVDDEILGGDCAAVIVDRPVVNIDDAFELELAAWLLEREASETASLPLAQPA